jgi:hypothetical protein
VDTDTVRPASSGLPFERIAAVFAVFVAVGAIVYSILFAVIVGGSTGAENKVWFLVLMVGGLATVPILVALYLRLRVFEPGLALTAFLLGLGAALGGVLHGGYELAAKITPPPNGYYPGPESVSKGILRYGVAGLAMLLLAFLIYRTGAFPRLLAYVGYVGGAVLIFIYVGRLYDFITPTDHATLIPPFFYGFLLHPIWYLGLAWSFWRSAPRAAP